MSQKCPRLSSTFTPVTLLEPPGGLQSPSPRLGMHALHAGPGSKHSPYPHRILFTGSRASREPPYVRPWPFPANISEGARDYRHLRTHTPLWWLNKGHSSGAPEKSGRSFAIVCRARKRFVVLDCGSGGAGGGGGTFSWVA